MLAYAAELRVLHLNCSSKALFFLLPAHPILPHSCWFPYCSPPPLSCNVSEHLWLFSTHKRNGVWEQGSRVTITFRHCTNRNRILIWALPRGYALFTQQTINNRKQEDSHWGCIRSACFHYWYCLALTQGSFIQTLVEQNKKRIHGGNSSLKKLMNKGISDNSANLGNDQIIKRILAVYRIGRTK